MTAGTSGAVQGTWPRKAAPSKETVVYLDPDPDTRTQTASELGSELSEHSVETSTGPAGVLEHLENDDVCCFVCDPDTGGWNIVELLEEVRDVDSELPVVLYTQREEGIAAAIAAGATNYLQRTSQGASAALVELVSSVAENYHERARLAATRYQSVLEELPEAVFVTDSDGTFTWVCPASERIFTSSTEIEKLGTVENLLEEKFVDRQAMEDDEVSEVETTITTADGKKREVLVTARPLAVPNGSVLYTVRDASERVEYDQQLAELHATTKKLMEAQGIEELGEIVCDAIEDILDISTGGVARYEQEMDGFVPVALTQGLRELYGGEPDVLPEGSLPERVLEQGEELILSDVSELSLPEFAGTEVSDRPQFGMQLDDRTVLGITAEKSTTLDQQTLELARILGEQVAIALERIKREQELLMKTRALDNAPVGISISDPDQEDNPLVYVNNKFTEITGYSQAEATGRNCRYLQGEGTAQEPVNEIRSAIDADRPVSVELRNYRRDGTEFWNDLQIAPVHNGDGSVTNYVGFQQDVTERKEHERELELFRSLMDRSTDSIFVEDPETGKILDVNETASRHLGYSSEELIGMTVPDIDANIDTQEAYQNFVAKLQDQGERRFDGVHCRKDGTTFPVEVNAAYVDLDDEHEYVLAIARDVTEQRERERELRRNKEFLEKTQEIAHIGGWDYDSRSDRLRWTDEVYRIHGLDEEFNPTVEETLEFYHEDDRPRIRNAFEQLRTAGERYDVEVRIVRTDGEVRWVRSQGEPWYEDGEIVGARGTFQDITERTERERRLREYKDVLEKAQAVGSIGWWKKDIPSDSITWSRQVQEMWVGSEKAEGMRDTEGITEMEEMTDDLVAVDHDRFLEFVHPDDQEYVEEQWDAAKDGAEYDIEHRIITDSGEVKWMRETAELSFDEDGNPVSAIGMVQNITALKEQEQALRQQTETLQELHKATQQLLTVEDETRLVASLSDHLDDVFDLDAVGVMRFDEQAGKLVIDDETASTSICSPVEPGDHPIWEVYRTGETTLVVSGDERPNWLKLDEDITAVLAVPLGGLGVILAATTETDGFPETTVEALEILVTNTEAVFDRMKEQQESNRLSQKLQDDRNRITELEQLMEAIQRIQRKVSEADSRDELERAVAEELAAMTMPEFVWLAQPRITDTDLSVETWAGQDNGYLDSIRMDDGEQAPAQRAAAKRQIVTISSISEHAQHEHWARTALACDFKSVVSHPIMHDGVLYGVLTAYAGETEAFDGLYLDLFEDLVYLLGSSISLLGQQLALSNHEFVELEFELTNSQYPLHQVATETGATIRFETVLQTTDETVRLLVTVEDGEPERVLETATQNPRVREVDWFGDEHSEQLSLIADRPFLATKIQTHGGQLVETVSEDGSTSIRIQLPSEISLRPLVESLSDQYSEMEPLSQRTKTTRSTQVPVSLQELLTERQFEILTAAYHGGYYETPRGVSGKQIAENFDISGPVVYNHLQAAHRTILDEAFKT